TDNSDHHEQLDQGKTQPEPLPVLSHRYLPPSRKRNGSKQASPRRTRTRRFVNKGCHSITRTPGLLILSPDHLVPDALPGGPLGRPAFSTVFLPTPATCSVLISAPPPIMNM